MEKQHDKYIGQMLDNRYEILEIIGRGGMANVYKARCHLLNRNVAVKILRDDMAADDEFREHFKREAQAVAMLSHANIVSIYDVSRTPEIDYIVMELIEGITLKQYMKSKGALSSKETVHFATQIARALSHAHSKGIIHRDIKPQNIMISMDGTVKVADFGIAWLESTIAEQSDSAVGSVHYISPEQARGYPPDARSDIYSLGVVMYEMVTGALPYIGESAEEVALQHISAHALAPHERRPDIPDALEAIVKKAMCADVNARYQSADELLADLDEYRLSGSGRVPVQTSEAPAELLPSDGPLPLEDPLPANVPPIGRSGEMTKERYLRRHRRSNKVSLLSGILLVLVFAVAVFVFLWNYWLRDLFSTPVRINIPNFVGSDYEDIISNKEFLKLYHFTVFSIADPDVEAGVIIRQDPAGGASRAYDSTGIEVELTVSAGVQMLEIPDVVNKEFRDAEIILQRAGFTVDKPYDYAASETITQDFVIATNPAAGDKLPAGSTIYMTVSTGPTIVTVQMPNLIGLTEYTAKARIEAANLALGTSTRVESDWPEGTVIWQSVPAYTIVEEHTRVYLQVSSGPKETEPPATPEPTEPPASPEPAAIVEGD